MAVSPVKVTVKERVKNAIDGFFFRGGSNEFYPGGANSQRRLSRSQLATDIAEMMSEHRHRMMLGDSRYIYQSFGNVSGMVKQKSRYVYGNSWRLQSHSEDKDFARAVEEDFKKIDTLLDVRGSGFTFRRNIKLGSKLVDVDGDYFIILTEDKKTGFPLLQYLEAHKVGDWGKVEKGFVKGGKHDGKRILTGVIVDDFMRPVAYRIKDESKSEGFQDMPASGVIHVADLEWFSQGRGTPTVVAGILDWYDLSETRDAQKIKQKVNSILTLVESNETGKVDAGRVTIGGGASRGKLASTYMDSGMIRIIKNGGSLKPHVANDPPEGWIKFTNLVEQSAFYASGWRREMLDSSAIGGAGVRGLANDINKSIADRIEVLEQAQRRCALYIIAKRAKQGVYDLPSDWFKVSFTRPAEFTVDEGRMRKADLEDLRAGMTTASSIIERRGQDLEETIRQRAKEVALKKKIAEEFGIDPTELGTLAMPGDPDQTGATDDPDGEDDDSIDFEATKQIFDAYGVGVRAGAITPQKSDESQFRNILRLPEISTEVEGAWTEDGGYRRPITLQSGKEAEAEARKASEEED